MPYFIHIADPGFPETPWPGVRRFGPFNTREEAYNQAVEDVSNGAPVLGIFSEDDSLQLQNHLTTIESPLLTEAEDEVQRIMVDANALRIERVTQTASAFKEDRDTLQALLPKGVTLEDIDQIIRMQRGT